MKQHYGKYLGVTDLLQLQKPVSGTGGERPAHDETLFIIIHQTYELWFKQILHELQACCDVLKLREVADDNGPAMRAVVHQLKRVVEIWKLLNHQVDVLETMTPLDFLDFRSLLDGASGFQSVQFREIEAVLGLRKDKRFRPEYYKHTNDGGFSSTEEGRIVAVEGKITLLQLVEQWLVRMPFFNQDYWLGWDEQLAKSEGEAPAKAFASASLDLPSFWSRYRVRYEESLSDRDDKEKLLSGFDEIFFKAGAGEFSAASLRAALFIMLYRDEPLFHLPFELLNALIEIDEQVANFRYRHLQMVRRMIGTRVGTGGSSGEEYLKGTVNHNYIYKELAGVITYLIERRRRPQLPAQLHRALSFNRQ